MSEKQMKRKFCQLTSDLDPCCVENLLSGRTGIGMPDVNLSTGAWVELKWAKHWPSKPSTPLRLPHYTDAQRQWALRRRNKGGQCFLVLQVGREWFVFDSLQMQHVGTLTRQELIDYATAYFPSAPSPDTMTKVFRA